MINTQTKKITRIREKIRETEKAELHSHEADTRAVANRIRHRSQGLCTPTNTHL